MLIDFFYFLAGLIFGSFLNVLVYRIPKSISIIFPRSHCTSCKKNIPPYNNIPLVSFLMLKGKCKYCKNKISIQYPLIELITGLLFVFSYNYFCFYEVYFFGIISSLLLCIAIIDFKHYIIPIKLFFTILFITLINAIFSQDLLHHVYGMLIGFSYLTFILILTWFIIKKQPMGFGDILLITTLGLWLGPLKILLTIFFSSLLGILYWGLISLKDGYNKNRKLPFGSFLTITSIIIYIIKI